MTELRKAGRLNVAIISGVCVRHDALSASVRDDALAFSEPFGFHARVFTYRNEYPEIDAVEVNNVNQIGFDPYFLNCDLIVYHFGIYYEFFNLIFLGNGAAPQVVRFHNVTPRALLPQNEWPLFERSSTQMYNLQVADAIWPVSELNRQDLLEAELVSKDRIEVIPLCVGDGQRRGRLTDKPVGAVRLLFVGRIVKAKGLTDLVYAAAILRAKGIEFSLRIVGEMRFSQPEFVRELKGLILALKLGPHVALVGGVSDDALEGEYSRAHVLVLPSYHEGFCKPVIEALRFGCIPVTYDASNLKYVAQGLSRTVPAGDTGALAAAIAAAARSVAAVPEKSETALIEVDRGALSLTDYERGVDEVIARCGFPAVSSQLRQSASRLIAGRQASQGRFGRRG
jgi:glycosyltransferase involved in cell wall biosynthesis